MQGAMSKAWSLRYTWARVQYGVEEMISQLQTSSGSFPEAVSKGRPSQLLACALSASEAGAACLISTAAPPLHLLARPADRRCWYGAGIEAYNRQLTSMLCLTGASMLPTLNPNAKGQDSAKDKLLMRLLPRAEQGRTVFVDDVVAFNPPFAAGNDGVMVRRVAALEGEEMVSSDKDDEAFELPQGRHQMCC